jgi:hypothetical protein
LLLYLNIFLSYIYTTPLKVRKCPCPCSYAGIPKINVPPLEPFVLPQLEIDRDLEAIKVRALVQNIVAYGGSGFVINRLK